MHPFPPASELQFLIGQCLDSIQLLYWQIILEFENGGISVEGDIEHVDSAGIARRHNADENRLDPLYLHRLIGQKVVSLEAEQLCVNLLFDQGDKLRIFSDHGQYECGQIFKGKDMIAIF